MRKAIKNIQQIRNRMDLQSRSGITLVSLVITIIILIILIAITTTIIINSNGTLKRAVWADKRTDVLAFRDEIEEQIAMYQIEQERSENLTFKSYIMKKFSVSEENITYYDAAKAVAFYYEDYFIVIDERELEVKCIGTDVIEEQTAGIVYKDILNDECYIVKVNSKTSWGAYWRSRDYFKKIKTAVFSDGLTEVSRSMLAGAISLENVYLPESVISVGADAFSSTRIKNIYMPSKLQTIGEKVFYLCDQLEKVHLPKEMISMGERVFDRCYKLKSIVIPNGVTSIGYRMFYYCWELKSITLPDTIEEIGEQAFIGCRKLKNLVIPDKVTVIQGAAIKQCYELTYLKLPESLTTIESQALYQCWSLEILYLPKSLTSISDAVFHGVPLSKIYYGGTEEDWEGVTVSEDDNAPFTENKIYYYSETEPETEGKYWHYDEDGNITEW